MRRGLDALYALCGALAAGFIFLIFLIILTQVLANTIDRIASLTTGRAFGLAIPSYADFAGFFLAAASFLGLAATLRKGALIRVNLVLMILPARTRRAVEIAATALAALIAGFSTVYAVQLALEAHRYNELSTGIIAVPMWIPQLSLIFGLAMLTVALVDRLVSALIGAPWQEADEEAAADGKLRGQGDGG